MKVRVRGEDGVSDMYAPPTMQLPVILLSLWMHLVYDRGNFL